MTDKYEEFKKYCNEQRNEMKKLFNEFEKEQTEKEKRKEFTEIIGRWLSESLANGRMYDTMKLFEELKEKDLIK